MARVALVTGANRGIGKEVARQLADRGLVALVAGRNLAKAEDAAAELGGGDVEIYARELDVADDESVERCFAGVRDEFGRLDVGGAGAPRSVDEGADTIVWAATLPDDGPTGGFFRDRAPIPW